MVEPLPGLAQGGDLKLIFTQKSKGHDEQTIRGRSTAALDLKLAGEEKDGWEVLRRSKLSIKLKKNKPEDRKLEDELWCLLYNMGFKELNKGRTFSIKVANDTTPRQLDVFAKDDDTVLIVECTQSKDSGKRSVKALIDKICSIRNEITQAIHTHYGRNPSLKVKFAIATRNIDWRSNDITYGKTSGIAIITHEDLEYFQKLTRFIKSAARYQFLGRYLRDERVEGLRTTVPATRGRMGGQIFYNFLMSPHDLLKIAYISHRAKTSNEDLEMYQRIVSPTRLKDIGRYIDEGGKFPTNIVVNLKTSGNLQFDLSPMKDRFEDTATGVLHLPGLYGSAWVIDGQHRLYGYAHAYRDPEHDHSVVSVLAYQNLPTPEEIKLFVDINTRQVKVSRNLVIEIVSSLDIDDDDPRKRLEALHARIVMQLDRYPSSPVRDRILPVAQGKTSFKCLTLTSLVDGIGVNNFLGTIKRSGRKDAGTIDPGPLADLSNVSTKTMTKAVVTISKYLNLFAEKLEAHWLLGDDKGGYLCTNNGIRALLVLFRKVLAFIEQKEGVKARTLDPDVIVEYVSPYITYVVDYFKNASASDIEAFRKRGSSLSTVDQNAFQFMSIIHSRNPAFQTNELREYMSNQDVDGTNEARELIIDINKIVGDDVKERLQDKYGVAKEAWWRQGVPKTIQVGCYTRWSQENNSDLEPHQYLNLGNYPDILLHGDNWDIFKENYSFPKRKGGNKSAMIAWMQRLIAARNVTHHTEKGPLSKEDVEFVRKVHGLVKTHIEGDEKVVSGKLYLEDEPIV